MKRKAGRCPLPALHRAQGREHATVVLGKVGTVEDVDVLTYALDNAEPLVRERAAWALARIKGKATSADVDLPPGRFMRPSVPATPSTASRTTGTA